MFAQLKGLTSQCRHKSIAFPNWSQIDGLLCEQGAGSTVNQVASASDDQSSGEMFSNRAQFVEARVCT